MKYKVYFNTALHKAVAEVTANSKTEAGQAVADAFIDYGMKFKITHIEESED